MEVIPGGQPHATGRKLCIDTQDSARPLGENPRKEQTVVCLGHGRGREHHTPLEKGCASVGARCHGMGNALTKHEVEVILCSSVYD